MSLKKHTLPKPQFIAGILILITLAVFLSSLFKQPASSYTPPIYSPEQLQKMTKESDKYVIIDVRDKTEYDRGHIPGAIHADYHDEQALKKAAGNKTPITYCTYSAWRGPYAAYQLFKNGYTNVGILTGGITSWDEKNQILETADNRKPFIFPHPEKDLLFPKRDLQEVSDDKNIARFSIIAKKFEFVPNRFVVKQNQKVILDIKSTDVPHGFALPEYHIVEELLPQKTKRIEFVANRKGVFPFLCSVYCGHDEHSAHSHMSMVGELIVE